jgi:hypothetical protein
VLAGELRELARPEHRAWRRVAARVPQRDLDLQRPRDERAELAHLFAHERQRRAVAEDDEVAGLHLEVERALLERFLMQPTQQLDDLVGLELWRALAHAQQVEPVVGGRPGQHRAPHGRRQAGVKAAQMLQREHLEHGLAVRPGGFLLGQQQREHRQYGEHARILVGSFG